MARIVTYLTHPTGVESYNMRLHNSEVSEFKRALILGSFTKIYI